MGARVGEGMLFDNWSAGFGDVVTRVRTSGPGTFRFEVVAGSNTLVFRSSGQVAWALYLSGGEVRRFMSSEQVLALVVAGAARGDFLAASERDRGGRGCADQERFAVCSQLGWQVTMLTHCPYVLPGFPQLHPDWRVNDDAPLAAELADARVAVPA